MGSLDDKILIRRKEGREERRKETRRERREREGSEERSKME